MITQDEEAFIQYWAQQRLRKKQFYAKLSIGLPLGVLIAGGLILNVLSGWYTKADMALHSSGSLMVVILIAAVAIVVFITVFGTRHKWDQNELRYRELLKKKEAAG